jgi:hypothetical protein
MLSAAWRGVKVRIACFFFLVRWVKERFGFAWQKIPAGVSLLVGQTLLAVRRNLASARVDRQECLSYRNRSHSGLFFFAARKFLMQMGAHASRKSRELEQILQIAPRQIRQERKYTLDRRLRMA